MSMYMAYMNTHSSKRARIELTEQNILEDTNVDDSLNDNNEENEDDGDDEIEIETEIDNELDDSSTLTTSDGSLKLDSARQSQSMKTSHLKRHLGFKFFAPDGSLLHSVNLKASYREYHTQLFKKRYFQK